MVTVTLTAEVVLAFSESNMLALTVIANPLKSSPPGNTVDANASSDLVWTTRIFELWDTWKANSYCRGASESLQVEAANTNGVFNSSPATGLTEKVPGRGAPLVTTTTVALPRLEEPRLLQANVNVKVARSGSELAGSTMLDEIERAVEVGFEGEMEVVGLTSDST